MGYGLMNPARRAGRGGGLESVVFLRGRFGVACGHQGTVTPGLASYSCVGGMDRGQQYGRLYICIFSRSFV